MYPGMTRQGEMGSSASATSRFLALTALMLLSAKPEEDGKHILGQTSAVHSHDDESRLPESRLLVVTVATDSTDGYSRYMKSAEHFGLKMKVVA